MAYAPASPESEADPVRASSITRVLALLLPALAPPLLAGACPPQGFDRAALETLKSSNFELADTARRQKLALALLPCLSDPDPGLRDGIAFEAYYTWMRAKALDVPTRTELLARLGTMLETGQADR